MKAGDSNLYLRRKRDRLDLTVEHRAAAAIPPLSLELSDMRGGVALRIVEEQHHQEARNASPLERIEAALA